MPKPDFDEQFAVAVVDYTSSSAAEKLTDSLKSTGFAVLTNTPVPDSLIQDVYAEWREFMIRLNDEHNSQTTSDTPTLAQKYYLSTEAQDGYFPTAVSETAKGATARDLKHYYQCYFPHGRYPSEVSTKAHKLWRSLLDLGKTLVSWIDENMPDEIKTTIENKIGEGVTLSDCVSDERTMLRILHYPGSLDEEPPGAVRAAAHEDINLITILPAGSARGLQVKSNRSDEWLEVPLVPGSIVINVGDMMQEMSDGAYVSTTHRVVKMEEEVGVTAPGGFGRRDRMSTPCFVHLKGKCPVSERFGSAEHYLKERLVTLGVVPKCVLDDFLENFPDGVVSGWDPTTE